MMTLPPPGPIALVGSGEFLPQMNDVDRALLNGRPQRAAFLPTAAGEEGQRSVRRWLDLGIAHYRRLGVEPVPVPVITAADASDGALAALLEGCGLIYLSGGNPGYLANTLRGSIVWEAIVSHWQRGGAVAGCSAGAGALSTQAPDVRSGARDTAGLGLVSNLAVIPHYDRMARWDPSFADRLKGRRIPGVEVVGIDEDTALVGGGTEWTVMGLQSVHILSTPIKVLRSGERWTVPIPNPETPKPEALA